MAIERAWVDYIYEQVTLYNIRKDEGMPLDLLIQKIRMLNPKIDTNEHVLFMKDYNKLETRGDGSLWTKKEEEYHDKE